MSALKIQTFGLAFCHNSVHVRDKYNINFYNYISRTYGASTEEWHRKTILIQNNA